MYRRLSDPAEVVRESVDVPESSSTAFVETLLTAKI